MLTRDPQLLLASGLANLSRSWPYPTSPLVPPINRVSLVSSTGVATVALGGGICLRNIAPSLPCSYRTQLQWDQKLTNMPSGAGIDVLPHWREIFGQYGKLMLSTSHLTRWRTRQQWVTDTQPFGWEYNSVLTWLLSPLLYSYSQPCQIIRREVTQVERRMWQPLHAQIPDNAYYFAIL